MKKVDGQIHSERIERHDAGEIAVKGEKVRNVPPCIVVVGGDKLPIGRKKLLGRACSIDKREISSSVSHIYPPWSAA